MAVFAPCHAQDVADGQATAEPARVEPAEEVPAEEAAQQGLPQLDAMVVTAAQPGPGMWKVSKGEHVLWILGTVSPLPRGMQWNADDVREVLERADQVLGSPGVNVGADVGMFRGMLLLPAAMKAAKNPDGRTLQDILPPDTYARWAVLKQRYIGRDGGIEKKRPFLAAEELYGQALKHSGLRGGVVAPVIDETLKRRKMKYTPTRLKLMIDDPRVAIADFRKEQPREQELACMVEMLDAIEHDIPRMVERANAWAAGDLEALRAMPQTERTACWAAWADTEAVRKRGMTDIEARVRNTWLETAEAALDRNLTTFATLPVADLFAPDGYLARLRAKGYAVEAPLH